MIYQPETLTPATDELEGLMTQIGQLMSQARDLMDNLAVEHTNRVRNFVSNPTQEKLDHINDIAGLLETFAIYDNALDDDDMFERYNGVHYDYIEDVNYLPHQELMDALIEAEDKLYGVGDDDFED